MKLIKAGSEENEAENALKRKSEKDEDYKGKKETDDEDEKGKKHGIILSFISHRILANSKYELK